MVDVSGEVVVGIMPTYDTITSQIHPGLGHSWSVITHSAYTRYVRDLAHYYCRSPELISYEEVTDWLYPLITERLLSASSVNVAVNAVRFLYAVTLGRETGRLDGIGPAHEARHPARGSLRAQQD